MSKKNKRARGKQRAKVNLADTARRALDKGNARQALKDAKVCFRNEPTEAHRQLLQEAYISRAEQLQKSGLQEQAKGLLCELEQAGATAAEVQQRVDRLRLLLASTLAAASRWRLRLLLSYCPSWPIKRCYMSTAVCRHTSR